jgi:KipI family sensor histidine kinase inhibitor
MKRAGSADTGQSGKTHTIPVRYDGEDLDDVARRTNLSRDQVIEIHAGTTYRVFVIGFVPGWAYLGTLDSRLVLPRRESPRKRVPSGSVAIAEAQTGIYPAETPGGWHLKGTTDVRLFDHKREDPALFAVGDRVRFKPV